MKDGAEKGDENHAGLMPEFTSSGSSQYGKVKAITVILSLLMICERNCFVPIRNCVKCPFANKLWNWRMGLK